MKVDGSKIIFALGVSASIAVAFVSLFFALR
jgi:hypothetical protein